MPEHGRSPQVPAPDRRAVDVRGEAGAAPAAPTPSTRRTTRVGRAGRPGRRPRRASTFTSRALILLLVVAVLGVSYASSIRAWLNQRSEQHALSAQIVPSGTAIAVAAGPAGALERPGLHRGAGPAPLRLGDAGRAQLPGHRHGRQGAAAPGTTRSPDRCRRPVGAATVVAGRSGQPRAGRRSRAAPKQPAAQRRQPAKRIGPHRAVTRAVTRTLSPGADRARRHGPARPAAARRRRGRPSLPVRQPDVVATAPRLADGSPFPTLYYLTCPRAASAIGTLEAGGLMSRLAQRLADDPELRERVRARPPGVPR